MKGKRRGRHKKRWEDNIKEWAGMEFVSPARGGENRTRWKWIVANSFVVPRWPSPLMTKSTSIMNFCQHFLLKMSDRQKMTQNENECTLMYKNVIL